MDLAEHLNPGFLKGIPDGGSTLKDREEPIVVWRLLAPDRENKQCTQLKILRSRFDSSHRQRAQRGYSSRLEDETHTDLDSFLSSRGRALSLKRITVCGRALYRALRDLHAMNITPSTMFPDLQRAAQAANIHRLVGARMLPVGVPDD
jgi:hypothetical protein